MYNYHHWIFSSYVGLWGKCELFFTFEVLWLLTWSESWLLFIVPYLQHSAFSIYESAIGPQQSAFSFQHWAFYEKLKFLTDKQTNKQTDKWAFYFRCYLWVLKGKLEENSEEISSVSLLSPACLKGILQKRVPEKFL